MDLLSLIRRRLQRLNYSKETTILNLLHNIFSIIIISTADYFLTPFFSHKIIGYILDCYISFLFVGIIGALFGIPIGIVITTIIIFTMLFVTICIIRAMISHRIY